jgi:ubiquitin-like modifier-activating enzyme ATG7
MYGEAFDKCIACSTPIIEEFKRNPEEFLVRACNQPDYLEELTGITKMMAEVDLDAVECFDDDFEME